MSGTCSFSAIARASSTGIDGCMSTPLTSLISACMVMRFQGLARSTSWPSSVMTVVPVASRAALKTIASTRSIMSW